LSNKALLFNISRTDNQFERQFRCISFAFSGTRLVTYGYNKMKTNPLFSDFVDFFKMSTHAEMSMLLNLVKLNAIYKITDIVVIRGSTNLLNSHPCNLCHAHLHDELESVRMWYFYNNDWNMEIL
jgi:hypothetical protein